MLGGPLQESGAQALNLHGACLAWAGTLAALSLAALSLAALSLVAPASALAAESPAPPSATAPARLVPAKATGVAATSGSIRGYADKDFAIRAGAGQALAVELKASNGSAYFNVLPPGATEVAMFVGSTSGSRYRGTAPIAGDYIVRVYLMRSAARRNETSTFTLSARVTGTPLAPLPASEDALVPGTHFHARSTVPCAIPYQPDVRECEAAVIRYGHDGTATVELRGPKGFVRRILFVRGTPSASDAGEALTSTRKGDTTTVRIGTEERYELPDALVTGG